MGMVYGSINHTTSGRKKKTTRRTRQTFKGVRSNTPEPYRRQSVQYRSAPETVGVAARVESPHYTGSLVKGIGTLHKSNAVPVIDEEYMKDIARMRR
jgi:hypothetical protein